MENQDTDSRDGIRKALALARESERTIGEASQREAGTFFLIWGAVYVLVPIVILTLPDLAVWLANGLVLVAAAITITLGLMTPIRSPLGTRLGLVWGVAALFAFVWMVMLGGENFPRFDLQVEGRQTWAFGISVAMMVYVVMGLITRYTLMIVLGLFVTAAAFSAFFFAWEWHRFWIWLIVGTGLPLLAAGIYCKSKPQRLLPASV
ncbi:MAG: hypothetical protein AAGA96_07015 [Verrucomicrobiota bacterium]